jgi:hypothetical protein
MRVNLERWASASQAWVAITDTGRTLDISGSKLACTECQILPHLVDVDSRLESAAENLDGVKVDFGSCDALLSTIVSFVPCISRGERATWKESNIIMTAL